MQPKEQEFLEKIDRHKAILFKMSKMYMDDYDNQKDLYQEMVYQAWKSFPNFEGRSEFSTWLYRIALNTAIIFLKNEKKNRNFKEHLNPADWEATEYDTQKDAQLIKMYDAIHQLNPIEKALVFLFLENYNGRQMAEHLGISEVNVRVKLNRAKKKLKELLNQ